MKFTHIISSAFLCFSLSLFSSESSYVVLPGKLMDQNTAQLFTLAENKNWTSFHCRLMTHWSKPDAIDQNGISLLHLATLAGEIECVDLLINQGHSPNLSHMGKINGEETIIATPFHFACKEGHLDIVKRMLEKDQSLIRSTACDFNNTPLHVAVFFDKPDIIDFLLKEGANIETPNSEGSTVFHIGAFLRKSTNIEKLLKNPTVATQRAIMKLNNQNNSPLDLAISIKPDGVKELILNFLSTFLSTTALEKHKTDAENKYNKSLQPMISQFGFSSTKTLNQ